MFYFDVKVVFFFTISSVDMIVARQLGTTTKTITIIVVTMIKEKSFTETDSSERK